MATPVPHPLKPARSHGRALWFAFLALLVLTAASWAGAHLPLGRLHGPFALAIAAAKALVVALVFMELKHADFVPRFVAVVTLLFIALMCSGVVADAVWR